MNRKKQIKIANELFDDFEEITGTAPGDMYNEPAPDLPILDTSLVLETYEALSIYVEEQYDEKLCHLSETLEELDNLFTKHI